MQTFLPYPNFDDSVACLDTRRLGKQRSEALVIFKTLRGDYDKWARHPAVRMWRGFERALALYYNATLAEWLARGHSSRMTFLPFSVWRAFSFSQHPGFILPPWLGDEAFHASHRAALLAKDPDWYGQYSWTETPKIEYVWPV